jgi:hypothetical protein
MGREDRAAESEATIATYEHNTRVLEASLDAAEATIRDLRAARDKMHYLATGLAIRCEILESARDNRLSLVETGDLAAHAHDTSSAIYAALDRILAETNAPLASSTPNAHPTGTDTVDEWPENIKNLNVAPICMQVVGGTPGDPGGTLSYCGQPLPCPDHGDKQPTPRETYDAYRKGEISADEADKRAHDWYAAFKERRPPTTGATPEGDSA